MIIPFSALSPKEKQPTAARQQLDSLRALLAEKFPARNIRKSKRRKIGFPFLDKELEGFEEGALTEICGSSAGGQLLLSAILDTAVKESFHMGLVDAANTFNPDDWNAAQLERMLWVACNTTHDAIKATDLLIRDANLPLLVLDLQGSSLKELRKIPSSTWHRFHRIIEETSCVLTVLTPCPLVERVTLRIVLHVEEILKSRTVKRCDLLGGIEIKIFQRGKPSPEIESIRNTA